jgi:hypothetical protein
VKCARGCDRPATHVIKWRHQDGDRERRILCQEHAVEDQKYWSAICWDTGVEVSDIEEWELSVSYGGKAVTRVGNRFNPKRSTVVDSLRLRLGQCWWGSNFP